MTGRPAAEETEAAWKIRPTLASAFNDVEYTDNAHLSIG
jgi:hypothetical protein